MTNEDRQTVIQALEAGRDAAAEVATRYHEAMAGYRKSEHERLDADVARIDTALAIMRREREPLTDEQIDALWRAPMSADWEHREFARAIESAHGIGKD